jgi:hypothetical protein
MTARIGQLLLKTSLGSFDTPPSWLGEPVPKVFGRIGVVYGDFTSHPAQKCAGFEKREEAKLPTYPLIINENTPNCADKKFSAQS